MPQPLDLQLDVRVPMRDGVLLSCDIYRPHGRDALPNVAHPHHLRQAAGPVRRVGSQVRGERIRGGDAGLPRSPRLGWPLGAIRQRGQRWPRHDPVDRLSALGRRQRGDVRHLLRRVYADAAGDAAQPLPEGAGPHRLTAGQLRALVRRWRPSAPRRHELREHGGGGP